EAINTRFCRSEIPMSSAFHRPKAQSAEKVSPSLTLAKVKPTNPGGSWPNVEGSLGFRRFGLRLVADLPANIWPKLLPHEGNRVVPDLCAPHACSIWQSLVGVRMITVRGD